jgi:hypothetical protein
MGKNRTDSLGGVPREGVSRDGVVVSPTAKSAQYEQEEQERNAGNPLHELFRELQEKYPGADLQALVKGLQFSLNRLPELAQKSRRAVFMHVQLPPPTVAFVTELIERLTP